MALNRICAIIISLALIAAANTACKKKQEQADSDAHNGTTSVPTAGLPVRINVIADGFGSSAGDARLIETFRINTLSAVKNTHPFTTMPSWVLEFASPKRLETTSLTSALGITPKETGCYFTFDEGFQDRLTEEKKKLPPARLTLVVVNVDPELVVGACAFGRDLIVTSTQIDRDAITHELGHALAALEDETTDGRGHYTRLTQAAHQKPNCSDDRQTPGWELVQTSTATVVDPVEGCEGYSTGLVRPYQECGMRSPGTDFCCICTEHMIRHISHLTQTRLSHVSVTHSCTVTGNEPNIDTGSPKDGWIVTVDYYSAVDARRVARQRVSNFESQMPLIAGDYYAGLTLGNDVISAVALPNDPQYARAYAPGKGNVDVPVQSPIPLRVSLFVPDGTPPELEPKLIELSGRSGVSLLNDQVRKDLKSKLQ